MTTFMSSITPRGGRDRARIQLVDVVMGFLVLVFLMIVAPWLYQFIGMVTSNADPFSTLLLQLTVPGLFLALIISVGVSARRGGP